MKRKKESELNEFKNQEEYENNFSFESFIERSTAFWWPISFIITVSLLIYLIWGI